MYTFPYHRASFYTFYVSPYMKYNTVTTIVKIKKFVFSDNSHNNDTKFDTMKCVVTLFSGVYIGGGKNFKLGIRYREGGTSFSVVANDWRTVPCDSMLMSDDLPLVSLWGEIIRIGRSIIKGLALCDGQSFKCYFECWAT
ncbi:hypothetical protein B5B97_11885 [Staphylococcus delphini]|nr:hypothetical protein B5B99_11920 [Staphylococcus delphini]PCF50211.1 hypothetical protein B5C03_11865 [Staphylococcus delphini]PCF54531.1 hypothetical protein B5B97_11885 [Staphylococcus delphini]PCF56713.1 hypothetical protein B5C05_11935 [Staphylococcus delphini]